MVLIQDDNDFVKLANGAKMHKIGLGTWKSEKNVCGNIVYEALKCGYKHIDCAAVYGNEKEIGIAFNKAFYTDKICTRESVFITSKLWNTYHRKMHVKLACKRTLEDLQLDYLDLYLIHFPISLQFIPFDKQYPAEWTHPDTGKMELDNVTIKETWEAMEELVKDGLVKAIGVSNFNCQLLQDLLKYATIKPVVNQVELHPYLKQDNLVKFCREYDISVTAYSPFGGISYRWMDLWKPTDPQPLEEKVIKNIAQKHGKLPSQVILRWSVQRHDNITVLAKTATVHRLKENLDSLNFQLTDEEVQCISNLNLHKRYNEPAIYSNYFGKFWPIFD